MKNFILSLSLLTLSAQAQTLTCNDGSYATVNFEKVHDLENFNLSWAKCEEKRENLEGSMSAYERVLMSNTSNITASLALIDIYSQLSMDKQKETLIRSLENIRLTPTERRILASLQKDNSENIHFRSSILLNAGYDSNVNLLPESNILAESAKESAVANLLVNLDVRHELEGKGGFSLSGRLNYLQQSVFMDHLFDLYYTNLEGGINYDMDFVSFSLPLSYSNVHYLNRNLINQYGITPNASILISQSNIVNFTLKYFVNEYVEQADKNRNSDSIETSASYYYLFSQNFVYLESEYEIFNATDANPLKYTNRYNVYLKTGISYAFKPYLITRFDYNFISSFYSDSIKEEESTQREDFLHTINLNIMTPINKNFNVQTNLSYFNNRSNYDVAIYEKTSFTVGIEYNY